MNKIKLRRAEDRIYAVTRDAIKSFSMAHPSTVSSDYITSVVVAALIAEGFTVPEGFKLHYGLAGVTKPPTEEMLDNKKAFEEYHKKALAAQEAAIDSLYFTGTDVVEVLSALSETLKGNK